MSKNYWFDGIMGVVTGDALGDAVQFMSRERVLARGKVKGMEDGGPFNTPAGTWTDDSAMTLATLASIVDKKEIDLDDIAGNFVKWLHAGEFTPFGAAFDIGITCADAINQYARYHDVKTCGKTGERANGNGALMRIMPACLYYYAKQAKGEISVEEAVEGVIAIASLTHNHLRTNICNGIYYFCVKSILDNKSEAKKPLIVLLQEGINNGRMYFEKESTNLSEMSNLSRMFTLDVFKNVDEDKIASSGYVLHTIEAAIWSLINTDSLKEALLKAVNLGDDADTVGAVTGGLAGLYYGYNEIPNDWISVIQRREWIEDMCKQAGDIA